MLYFRCYSLQGQGFSASLQDITLQEASAGMFPDGLDIPPCAPSKPSALDPTTRSPTPCSSTLKSSTFAAAMLKGTGLLLTILAVHDATCMSEASHSADPIPQMSCTRLKSAVHATVVPPQPLDVKADPDNHIEPTSCGVFFNHEYGARHGYRSPRCKVQYCSEYCLFGAKGVNGEGLCVFQLPQGAKLSGNCDACLCSTVVG